MCVSLIDVMSDAYHGVKTRDPVGSGRRQNKGRGLCDMGFYK